MNNARKLTLLENKIKKTRDACKNEWLLGSFSRRLKLARRLERLLDKYVDLNISPDQRKA